MVDFSDEGGVIFSDEGGVVFADDTLSYSGAVVIAGRGTVAIQAKKSSSGSIIVSGRGTIALSEKKGAKGTSLVSGAGSIIIQGIGSQVQTRSVSISARGIVTAAGKKGLFKSALVSGAGTISFSGRGAKRGTATSTGSGSVLVTGQLGGYVNIERVVQLEGSYHSQITDQDLSIFAGDSVIVRVTLSAPIAGVSIKWQMAPGGPFNAPAVLKSVGTGISIVDILNGVFDIELTPADTLNLAGGKYYHEAEMTDSLNHIETVTSGYLTLTPTLIH